MEEKESRNETLEKGTGIRMVEKGGMGERMKECREKGKRKRS